jgi:hypothetical protein
MVGLVCGLGTAAEDTGSHKRNDENKKGNTMTPEDFDNLLKPFDLDASLRGKRVATRRGLVVTHLRELEDGLLIGICNKGNETIPQVWDQEGKHYCKQKHNYKKDLELFMAPDKMTGAVCVFDNGETATDVMFVLKDLIDKIPTFPTASLRKVEWEGDNPAQKPKEKREGWMAVIRRSSHCDWETSKIHSDKYNLQPFEKAGLPIVKVEWEE